MYRRRRLTAFLPLLLVLVAVAVPAEDELLLPDQAFRISGRSEGPGAVVVSWDIADGYYMYRSKFKFRSETNGIAAGNAGLPPAETRQDEFFGAVEIYRGRLDIRVPLERGAGAGNILTLETSSQGCADAGLCYPPHRQKLLLELPEPAVAAPKPEPAAGGAAGSTEPPALGALAQLNQSLGLGAAGDTVLQPEEAYQFKAEVSAPDRLQLTWDIAAGTYLYQEKIAIALEDATDVTLGAFTLPEAEVEQDMVRPDGTVGDIAVYHERIDLALPLRRGAAGPTRVTLVAKYQGCAERGICYPPITERVSLDLPAAIAVTAGAATVPASTPGPAAGAQPAQPGPRAPTDRIGIALAGGNLWAIVALFFGLGLLLAFTPCVFPMIPILSGIIAGHGLHITTRRAFVLSSVYVLFMALTYAVAGVLAGLFGANIQVWFQNPWILSAFALVFVALALSMFGFYDLQLPSRLQSRVAAFGNRQRGGTLGGVAVMGLLSALIVGPCVAPPLAGALMFIGQSGDALLGFVALFALSLGMGAPLIAIGTSAGKLLPRAGAWMDAVKAVFGVALLAVAIVLLERVLPPAAAMVLWALLLVCSAVYLGALEPLPPEASGWSRLWKGTGVVLLVCGVLMLVGAAAGGKDTVQPLRGLAASGGAAVQQATFRRIKTVADLDRELAAAGKPVMLDFYADWCVSCKEMERYTFSDPTVSAEMTRFVLLQADVTANDAQDQALMQGRFGIPGPPAILFFDPSGTERRADREFGFTPAAEFADRLRRVAP